MSIQDPPASRLADTSHDRLAAASTSSHAYRNVT
jgi:hypothetical protein